MESSFPRKLYLKGMLLCALLLVLFPTWTGRAYSRADGSATGSVGRWYESGAFGLQGGVDVIDFVQQAPLWRPPRGFSDEHSVRWPWQTPTGSHIDLAWNAMAAEFSLGLIVLGLAARTAARHRGTPMDLVVTLGWWIGLSLVAAFLAIVVIGVLTMGALLEGVAIRALLGLGLVAGVAIGSAKYNSQQHGRSSGPLQPANRGATLAWFALGVLLAACLALAVAWSAHWFRGPVSNFQYVRKQWPIDVAAVLTIWGAGVTLARWLWKHHMSLALTAGLLLASVALGLTFNLWDPTFP